MMYPIVVMTVEQYKVAPSMSQSITPLCPASPGTQGKHGVSTEHTMIWRARCAMAWDGIVWYGKQVCKSVVW